MLRKSQGLCLSILSGIDAAPFGYHFETETPWERDKSKQASKLWGKTPRVKLCVAASRCSPDSARNMMSKRNLKSMVTYWLMACVKSH